MDNLQKSRIMDDPFDEYSGTNLDTHILMNDLQK